MKQATFTELRNHAKQYFDIVESGESVRVLRNGKPIADIVPVLAEFCHRGSGARLSPWCWMARPSVR